LKSIPDVNGAFKLPKLYVKLVRLLFTDIHWISTAIGISSIIILYFAKSLNERYKSKIRIVLPFELILVC
jgi:MFS superfamily sulfate permease-like transporter